MINRADNIFNQLLVWQDRNQNGETEKGELADLNTWGVHWIKVNYKKNEKHDHYGNIFREHTVFAKKGEHSKIDLIRPVTDVWFRTLPVYSDRKN